MYSISTYTDYNAALSENYPVCVEMYLKIGSFVKNTKLHSVGIPYFNENRYLQLDFFRNGILS